MAFSRNIFAIFICFFFLAAPLRADVQTAPPERPATSRELPPESTTAHAVTLDGQKFAFTARAGAVRLQDAHSGAPQADVGYAAFERAENKGEPRPIVFLFNGGPGAGSAWLALGAASPWRLRFADQFSPSEPPALIENAESWLAFADLVFIDPPGTGYSRILGGDDAAKRFYSVGGDVDALAVAIRKWLAAHRRRGGPLYLAGESYGGFRAVKLVEALREHENIGVSGLLLISPALDLGWLEGARNMLTYATLLPSYAAVDRAAKDRRALADVEAYAAGDYVLDLLKGRRDPAVLARMSERVAGFTGLDQETVRRLGGRVDAKAFERERRHASAEVLSAYDAMRSGYDPQPYARGGGWADPVLDALRPVFGAAMARLTVETLGWPVGEARYEILNERVAHDWDFGPAGRAGAEAISDLRQNLALDRRLRVTVAHGLTDLVTPYFASKILLDQLPPYGDAARLQLIALPGGHMFYTQDESRKALRDAARALIAPAP